jgi:hypothetical protein
MINLFIIALSCTGIIGPQENSSYPSLDISKDSIPPCVRKRIVETQTGVAKARIGSVVEYEYNGKKVYYLTTECCDNSILLVDSNCKLICKPYADIRGSDSKCKTIVPQLTNRKIIWLNKPRVPPKPAKDSLTGL